MPNLNEQINIRLGQLQSEIEKLRESELRNLVVDLIKEIRELIGTLNVLELTKKLNEIIQKLNESENHLLRQDKEIKEKYDLILEEFVKLKEYLNSEFLSQSNIYSKRFKISIWILIILIIILIANLILSLLSYLKL